MVGFASSPRLSAQIGCPDPAPGHEIFARGALFGLKTSESELVIQNSLDRIPFDSAHAEQDAAECARIIALGQRVAGGGLVAADTVYSVWAFAGRLYLTLSSAREEGGGPKARMLLFLADGTLVRSALVPCLGVCPRPGTQVPIGP
jgi:hypothetical protein